MKKVFRNSSQLQCIFTDEGITFCGVAQDVYFPYGCIDSVKLSLFGILQATSHTTICSFAVERADRAGVKEMVKFAREAIPTAPRAEPLTVDLTTPDPRVDAGLSPAEQLQRYKAMFIQGAITKAEYDIRRLHLQNS